MSLIRDERYEEMALSYQCHMIALLDATLQHQGISEEKKRRNIVVTFLFELGRFHDEGWLRPSTDAKKAYPLLCFSEKYMNTMTRPEDLGDVLATSSHFSFEEYAISSTEQFYDNDPDAMVETGIVSDDDI